MLRVGHCILPLEDAKLAVTDDAFLVEAEVLQENGAWVVYLEIWFADGPRRHRIDTYYTEAKARLAARWIQWAARREIDTPKFE